MAVVASCPSCEASLKVGDQYRGRKIKCPKCGSAITVGAAAEKAEQSSRNSRGREEEEPALSRKPARTRRDEYDDEEEDDEDDRPRSRKSKKRKKEKSRVGLWIGLGVGVLLLVGGAVAAVMFLSGGDGGPASGKVAQSTDSPPGKQNPDPADDSGGGDGGGVDVVVPPVVGSTLTSENLQKLKAGMTEKDVVAIFGTPRDEITGAEVARQLHGNDSWASVYQDEIDNYKKYARLLAYLDTGKVLLVAIGKDQKVNRQYYGKILRAWLRYNQGGAHATEVMELQEDGKLHHGKMVQPNPG